jgi:protein tyrosine phosphatase
VSITGAYYKVLTESSFLYSDGQGRSGTFAALCSVLERVKTEQVVDVFQTVKALRIQRPGLVKDVVCYEILPFVIS